MNMSLARTVLLAPAVTASLLALGCNVTATSSGTGGVGDAGGDAGVGCDRGTTVLLTDYMSTQIALSTPGGSTQSASFLSTASTMASGLAFALSGDVVLPSTTPPSGRVVLLDRFGTNVLTWADPSSGKVLSQLPVGAGFESNPQDYLEIDATHAYVSRWGDNAAPGKQPFDQGSDVLVLDLHDIAKPILTKSIPMPVVGGLPPRPARMLDVGGTVVVVLQRTSDDFATVGDAMLIGLANEAIAWQLVVAGFKNCDRPVLSPSGRTMAMGCEGQLATDGTVMNPAASGILVYDVSSLPPRLVNHLPVVDQLGSPVQSGVAWMSETVLLGKTQTPLGGATDNQAFTLDVTSGKASVLLTAHKDAMGKGKGIVYGDVLCRPGCGDVCLMADGDVGKLRRWSIAGGSLSPLSDVEVDPKTGLSPVALGGY